MDEIALHTAKCREDGSFTPRVERMLYHTEPLPESMLTPQPSQGRMGAEVVNQ